MYSRTRMQLTSTEDTKSTALRGLNLGKQTPTQRPDNPIVLNAILRVASFGDHDVQAGTIGQGCVDERRTQVDAAARGVQHPLDDIAHFARGEAHGRELRHPVARHKNAVGATEGPISTGTGSALEGVNCGLKEALPRGCRTLPVEFQAPDTSVARCAQTSGSNS
jgi:hypothetical protein